VRKQARVSRPRGPGVSKQHCKVLALHPDSPKQWPIRSGIGQIAQGLADLLKCWPICSRVGQFAEVLARLPKGWLIRSSIGQFAQVLTRSFETLPEWWIAYNILTSVGRIGSKCPIQWSLHDLAALVRDYPQNPRRSPDRGSLEARWALQGLVRPLLRFCTIADAVAYFPHADE
jgi:hypothetical protein